jgi:hypothetical protein
MWSHKERKEHREGVGQSKVFYELLIRYLWKAGLKSVYVPACFVTMRMGGRSTKGWRSNLLLNREIVRGNRENGVYTNLAMLVPKYAFKVWEFMGRK